MDRRATERLLAHGEVTVLGRVPGSSNQALYVALRAEEGEAHACYKAEVAERPLWDFPTGLWRREVAAYELDRLAGTDLVPVTVARATGPFGPGSLQLWIERAANQHYFDLRGREEFAEFFECLAAFDVVANNADRKAGHILLADGRLWAIDNGLCFHDEDKLRTVIWDFAGREISERAREALERITRSDDARLATLLSPSELEGVHRRARDLLSSRRFPEPREDADYPPYPWPLI